jgi:hypothetical protein
VQKEGRVEDVPIEPRWRCPLTFDSDSMVSVFVKTYRDASDILGAGKKV